MTLDAQTSILLFIDFQTRLTPAIDNGAEAIANGMLFVNSGSAGVHQPGNALIAFTVGGR